MIFPDKALLQRKLKELIEEFVLINCLKNKLINPLIILNNAKHPFAWLLYQLYFVTLHPK